MNKILTFSFTGGDLRQLRTASMLAADGFHVRIFGFDEKHTDLPGNIHISTSVSDCIADSDVIVLPLPYSATGGKLINTPLGSTIIETQDIVSEANEKTIIFAGKVNSYLDELCRSSNIRVIDYASREELAVMNAIPTAEGAIEIAMANTPSTLHGSRCLVIGYGRIGKILSADLKALGADVTATARKYSDLAWIKANGCTSAPTYEISAIAEQFDIIFNTVPFKILDFKALSATKKDVLIIDLASRPGGVDFYLDKFLYKKRPRTYSAVPSV